MKRILPSTHSPARFYSYKSWDTKTKIGKLFQVTQWVSSKSRIRSLPASFQSQHSPGYHATPHRFKRQNICKNVKGFLKGTQWRKEQGTSLPQNKAVTAARERTMNGKLPPHAEQKVPYVPFPPHVQAITHSQRQKKVHQSIRDQFFSNLRRSKQSQIMEPLKNNTRKMIKVNAQKQIRYARPQS